MSRQSSRWVWLLATPVVLAGLIAVAITYKLSTLDSDPVYVGALQRANASAPLTRRLGSPVTVSTVRSVRFGHRGTRLVLGIEGPKGRGTLFAYANGYEPDSLEIFGLRAQIEGSGEVISLDGTRSSTRVDF